MNKRTLTLAGGLLALLLFFAINVLASAGLRSVRLDLTEENLYTLSEGAKKIARELDEPLHLYFYYSQSLTSQAGDLKNYGVRVREMIEEFVAASNGNIELEIIDPEPFSEEEDRAVQEGIAGIPVASGEAFYFGLVGTNSVDDRETIPFFSPRKERFLEYDISRLIYTLSHPDKNVVGIITSLPMEGAPGNPMMGQQGTPPWLILKQLGDVFETRMLGTQVASIPEDVSVLMLVHPRDLPEETLYAIDQYVLGGGKAVVFVDPHCESDQSGVDPTNPMSRFGATRGSNLPRLFQAWGLELVQQKIVGDRERALRVTVPQGGRYREIDFVCWLGLDAEDMNQTDAVTSLLTSVRMAYPGSLRALPGATTRFEPLAQSSEDSMLIDTGMVQFQPDPEALLASFVSEFQKQTLAARIDGPARSAFPDGAPPAPPSDGEVGEDEEPEEDRAHVAESQGINVIVVADADMLEDRFWIQEQRLGPLSLGYAKTADNGDLVINAIENLSGGEDLISLRARGKYSRPFHKIEELRKDAEQRYLAEEQELERKLQDAESRINELQREKSPEASVILSTEQQEEIQRAREEMVATKKKLRDVQHNLRKDIESLQTKLKWVNILAVPLAVSVLALGLGAWRVSRRTP